MNVAHWHLMLTHFPVVGLPLGALLWSLGWGLGSRDLQRTALVWLPVMGGVTWFAYWTGQQSHEPIHDLLTIPHSIIEHHAQWAWRSLLVVMATTILAVIIWRCPSQKALKAILLGMVWFGTILILYTAHLGGLIHHPEAWSDFSPVMSGHHQHHDG